MLRREPVLGPTLIVVRTSHTQLLLPTALGSRRTASLITACVGEPGDVVQIREVEVSPDPPQIGQVLTINVGGDVKELIDVG